MNSGPLSDLDKLPGTPRRMNRSGQDINDIRRVQLAFHPDRQTFATVFIQDVQCPEGLAIVRSVMDEVI